MTRSGSRGASGRRAVIVGVGHVTRRPADLGTTTEPADLLAEAVWEATDDAHLDAAARGGVDALDVVNLLSWKYADPGRQVAARAGLSPPTVGYGPMGGEQPTTMVATMARRVQDGEVEMGVVVGGEALASRRL